MKKLIYMSTLVLAALTFNSCSSDDNSNGGEKQNPLVGKWEATTLSYTHPGGTNTHAFSTIKEGCAVDVIELTKEKVGTVKVENKVDQVCAPSTAVASWNGEAKTITVIGEDTDRKILSIAENEMILAYMMTYPKFGTIEVQVTYKRK